jgi:hypothetical protein
MAAKAPVRTVDMNDVHWSGTALIHIYTFRMQKWKICKKNQFM